MLSERAITVCLLEILREYSDAVHILSMSDIIKKLDRQYGITPDRRTVYSALEILTQIGYDISFYKENGKGYYLHDRQLEASEAHLLSDAVCTFPFISENQTAQLMKKIQSLVSIYERKQIKNLTVVRAEQKTINKNVFFNIEMLDEAIEKKVKVKFDYFDYGTDKQLHKRREKKYTVNPYGMVYNNEHYYLVCVMAKQERISLYRIDRIQNVEITDYELDERERDFDPQKAVKSAVYAHTGAVEDVEMLIEPRVLNDVIDKFGTDLILSEESDGRIKVRIKASVMGMTYWALQFLGAVEVTKPESLRAEIVEVIKNSRYMK